ncbi:alkaline phosphatase family protein [Aliidiomarina iranensis]|uniref:Alkaline phosphatase family protein n=1 Tax=Aliidiomarina iranensis TaxID=1434071 RepID=A0A432W1A0_9GAMM|nr:alkaline phosphatase family protein [Aliidiomarina iranensis]
MATTVLTSALFSSNIYAQTNANEQQQQWHELEPTVILISIDGARHDYLDRYAAPNLNRLANEGLRAEHLQPVFPTKTFPNHYSLVTGLHPQNHGITENSIYDPNFDAIFRMSITHEVTNPRWWGGEPIWVTAELQDTIAGTFFFPGSEAPIKDTQATYWFPYDGSVSNRERVDTVIEWLEKPQAERPQMITLYFSDVDSAGHGYGPGSREVAQALRNIDNEIGHLVTQLEQRGWLDSVDIMITADHGMARVDQTKHMVIDQAYDSERAERALYSRELAHIFAKDGEIANIVAELEANLPHAQVFTKETMPARFHYTDNDRIADVLAVANPGWIFAREFRLEDMQNDPEYFRPRGSHGYDNEHPDMQGIFIAHGPSFKQNAEVGPVKMVDLYNVVAHILALEPAANDGNPAVIPMLLNVEPEAE